MSFGLSPGDIRLAWQLGSFLHEKCFTKAQGADVLYLKFGREIESFNHSLLQLESVIKHADDQRPRRPWGNRDEECRVALQPVAQAVGDFKQTLDECKKLLDDHARFQRDEAGFVDNVIWHVSTQRDVDSLRERVLFHSTKLLVITKPFEIQLLLDIRRELQAMHSDVIEIKGLLVNLLANGDVSQPFSASQRVVLPEIPPEIAIRFVDSLQIDTPSTFQNISGIPLKEGFDALVHHFSRSTVEFNAGFDPGQRTPEETQFVNLLKSKWILERMEESSHLKAKGTASLWTSALMELKWDIIKEYKRFDSNQLTAPPKDVVLRLPDKCFSIWIPDAQPLLPPDLVEQRPLEDQILELLLPDSVGSRKSTLHVFRRSSVELRLVTTIRDTANPGYHQEQDFIVNTNVTRVIPAYATPDGSHNGHNLLLSNRHVQDLRWQYLRNAEDVEMLQQALTGYRVHHKMEDISWSINGSSKPGKCGKARLQMWQPQSLQKPTEPSIAAVEQRSPSWSSPRSSVATSQDLSARSTAATTSSTLFSGSSATSVMAGSRGNGTAVLLPEPPIMILFTIHEGKYTFLHLELKDFIFVNIVIETKNKTIDLRRSNASQASGTGLYTWDLARFRIPRHPDYSHVEILPKVEYLTLKFNSVAEKDEFKTELKLLERVRYLEYQTYQNILREKQDKHLRPTKR
ncbi:MAG: hypothetical protein HETSPECPRED_005781 [Heterodermia speciosa]|uniref:Uncharacterized protein n=1 Tax=Heterodermia speciosa TaxID=116794 RepID=A0A8H3FIP5_9LECA|nr:MAG: hypothetical protein HETSPECPRED_005781 [Heterodermia speciosa]